MKKIILLILLQFIFASCQGLSDAGKVLRNEKIKTNDEFLVKKRKPLVLPPDYNELPEPGKLPEKQQSEEENLKKIIKGSKIKSQSGSRGKSSVEKSILDKIKN